MLVNSPYRAYTASYRQRCEWMQEAVTVVCVAVRGVAGVRGVWA